MIWFVVSVGIFLTGVLVGIFLLLFYKRNKMEELQETVSILILWLEFIEKGNSIVKILKTDGIKKVAIYGTSHLSRRLVAQLKNTEVNVAYIISSQNRSVYDNLPVLPLDEKLEYVDAIIVTQTCDYYNVKEKIENVVDYKILSIETIVRGA